MKFQGRERSKNVEDRRGGGRVTKTAGGIGIGTIVIAGIIFFGFGFGLYGQLERYEMYYVVLGIWIFQLIVSPIWLAYFKYGPAEWLWRSLTYLSAQDFRRSK